MKVVFDTNLFVSAFLVPGSQGEQALLLAHRRKVDLYSSVPHPHRARPRTSCEVGTRYRRRVEDDQPGSGHCAPVTQGSGS